MALPLPPDTTPLYDVIVVGAGPAGCEAALAAAAAGAHTLCLTINLDTVGFPPASPVIVEDADDMRHKMLSEMRRLGARFPDLALTGDVAVELEGGSDFTGRVVIDRRRLGLAWKEAVESAERVELRQALVTGLDFQDSDAALWQVTGNLGERFAAGAVVIATGTYLKGLVEDGGAVQPGGRRGEIPANSLADALSALGLLFTEVSAATSPRIDSRSVAAKTEGHEPAGITDGSQLSELMTRDPDVRARRVYQLAGIRESLGEPDAWMTRPAYAVRHRVLRAGQVGVNLESGLWPGLFFTGRTAGCCNYTEAAMLGFAAGKNAAASAMEAAAAQVNLTPDAAYMNKLCEAVANRESRPVTIRIEGPGC